MIRFCSAVAIMALSVLLLAPASAEAAAEIKVSNVKVVGDPTMGSVDVEFHLEFTADAPGDIVFLCVAAGQDAPIQIRTVTGKFKGNVKAKLSTTKSWAALKGTKGNKPIPIVVHACEVYDLSQASVWIANHASYRQTIQTLVPK